VGRGLVPDRTNTALAASPEFDGGVRCASDDIGANLSARYGARNARGGAAAGPIEVTGAPILLGVDKAIIKR
jgi:hypothetical protein